MFICSSFHWIQRIGYRLWVRFLTSAIYSVLLFWVCLQLRCPKFYARFVDTYTCDHMSFYSVNCIGRLGRWVCNYMCLSILAIFICCMMVLCKYYWLFKLKQNSFESSREREHLFVTTTTTNDAFHLLFFYLEIFALLLFDHCSYYVFMLLSSFVTNLFKFIKIWFVMGMDMGMPTEIMKLKSMQLSIVESAIARFITYVSMHMYIRNVCLHIKFVSIFVSLWQKE